MMRALQNTVGVILVAFVLVVSTTTAAMSSLVCPLLAPLVGAAEFAQDPEMDEMVRRFLQNSLPTLFNGPRLPYVQIPIDTRPFEQGAHHYLRRLREGAVLSEREAVLAGTVLEDLLVVTHQTRELQHQTAVTMKSQKFQNVPRVLVLSSGFPAVDPAFAESGTLLTISQYGYIPHPTIAKTVYFTGGLAGHCLKSSVESILRNARAANLTHVRFVFLADLIYPLEGNESLATTIATYRFLRDQPYKKTRHHDGSLQLDFNLTAQYSLHLQIDIQ